jgi:hypothetical protein
VWPPQNPPIRLTRNNIDNITHALFCRTGTRQHNAVEVLNLENSRRSEGFGAGQKKNEGLS